MLAHVAEGIGTRKTARLTGVHKDTVTTCVVFGPPEAVASALALSSVSRSVNTCFVERHNGTDRSRCSRKVHKSYAFSKDWDVHRAATAFSYFSSNFCWPVRTLRVRAKAAGGDNEHRQWPSD